MPKEKAKTKSNPHLSSPELRVTDTHIYFAKGILSNWYPSPSPFPGNRALELCLSRLDALEIPHPAEDAISTRLIQSFHFGRGEQWIMAMKAWLFERGDAPLGEKLWSGISEIESWDELRGEMLADKPLAELRDPPRKLLRESLLCRIMHTKSPKTQKMLGRKVPNFDEELWSKASGVIVVAGCIARGEVDRGLKGLYLSSGERTFVEGSSTDSIWGVGLDWMDDDILDESKWRGMNRLGEAHGEAARMLREMPS